MWREYVDQCDEFGDFSPMLLPLDKALEYVAKGATRVSRYGTARTGRFFFMKNNPPPGSGA
jgi:hypothetical protein